ncbi:anti-sigma factor [Sphingomonas sp. NFR15]|uniref:anti-sigma factor family protein n=1 Tax=Sphingomonas sp. NFR15 TaxID=1566282 RepID=UPI00087E0989|nr:anti-sigma factor [Sphingomonas sp. NFR15]SDA24657.1 Transmembrane transcriptional regulator (anti-sigma factor RsiW) [Sphingomonas sp. NFR15]
MSDISVTEAELQAHVDGRLAPDREVAVAAWLAARPEEAARLLAYRSQRDALRRALDPIVDEPLPPALDLRLREAPRARWFARARPAFAANVAALLLLGGAGGWMLRGWSAPPTVGTAALAREAAASYSVYASDTLHPVEIAASQRGALDGWISARLSRPIKAPDLRGAGLELIGGRLVASEHGPAGLYLYRYADGGRVAVYVRPMQVDRTDKMVPRKEGGVRGWTWADNGMGFGIFSGNGDGGDTLHNVADMIRTQFERT